MTREGKTVTLAGLTISMYALTGIFQYHTVIFPFPLNEIIFLIVAISFCPIHFKVKPYTSVLVIIVGVLAIFSNEFYWQLFLNSAEMTKLSEGVITDLFKIAYHLGLVLWMIVTAAENKSTTIRALAIIPICLLLAGLLFNQPLIEYSSILLIFIYSIFHVKHSPSLYLWVLLFILESTKVCSLASLY